MNDPQDPLLLDHEVDGIRELDNKLPTWWVWLFYITIAFGVVYMFYYHVLHAGNLMEAEYKKEMLVGDQIKGASLAKFEESMSSMEPSKDPAVVALGQNIFSRMCAPCHAPDGGGLVGPNLCDDYWIHGPKFSDNLKIIWNGVPEKGMVTWKTFLKPQEVHAVGSYIYTLRGTKPKKPKPPENQAPAVEAPNPYE